MNPRSATYKLCDTRTGYLTSLSLPFLNFVHAKDLWTFQVTLPLFPSTGLFVIQHCNDGLAEARAASSAHGAWFAQFVDSLGKRELRGGSSSRYTHFTTQGLVESQTESPTRCLTEVPGSRRRGCALGARSWGKNSKGMGQRTHP